MRAIEKGEVTMMVIADYSKVFDTVKFKAILTKMHKMGFSSKFLLWILNYLSDCYQFVQVDDRSPELACVQFGVPQRSILDPVIFNLYVTDLVTTCSAHATNTQMTQRSSCIQNN